MGFFQNIFGGGVLKREQSDQQTDRSEQPRDVKGGSFRKNIVYSRNPQAALTVSAVHRAIELRAKTLAQMPVQLRRKDYRPDR